MSAAPLRVLIADDHVPTRTGVRMALEASGCAVCAEVGSADAAITAARKHRPDVCLIDLHMPGDGLRAVADITQSLPGTRVVVLTVSADSTDLFAALRAGAVGYLLKDMDSAGLGPAVQAAARGEVTVPRRLVGRLVDAVRYATLEHRLSDRSGRSVEFTPREWEVLALLADDLSTAEIAVLLGLDQVTVRRHGSNVVHKLGVATRQEAVDLLSEQMPR